MAWNHSLVVTTLPLSAFSFPAFIYIENQTEETVLPVELLLERTVLAACLTNWFITMARFGLFFYGPIYFQVQSYSATQAGLRSIAEAIGGAIMSVGSRAVMRWTGRYYALNVLIQAIFLCSLALTSALKLSTPPWLPFLYFFLAGIGYSGILTVTLVALIAAADQEYQAVITFASYALRSTGSTIGITIASVLFQRILIPKLRGRLSYKDDSAGTTRRVGESSCYKGTCSTYHGNCPGSIYGSFEGGFFVTLLGIAGLGAVVSLQEHVRRRSVQPIRSCEF